MIRKFFKNQFCNNSGVSLLELSIVLVIIGLIVTGVTKARDLISSAKLNSQIAQIKQIESALETFKITYGALPGDIKASDATIYSDISTSITGASDTTFGRGNNDGFITSDVAANPNYQEGESLIAWRHLKMANIFSEAPNTASIAYDTAASSAALETVLPLGKFDNSVVLFTAYDTSQTNAHRFYDATRTVLKNALTLTAYRATWNSTNLNANAVVSSIDAYNLDLKIDDGLPMQGFVQGIDTGKTMSTILETPTTCADTTTYLNLGSDSKTCSIYYILDQ